MTLGLPRDWKKKMRNLCVVTLFISLATAVLIAQAATPTTTTPPAPSASVDDFRPSAVSIGDALEIVGSGFGGDKGKVFIGDKEANVSSWTDKSILASVPGGISTGNTAVEVTLSDGKTKVGSKTPAPTLTVKAPEYDQSAFEVLTGVGASFLPVENTGYKVDSTNNALSQTNVGRKHIELLLGGGFILPWVRLKGDHGDSTYKDFRPLETFLSIRFAPGADQSYAGFVVGGGYRVHKYFSLLVGYSLTPIDEPTSGFRRAAAQVVAANPTIFPYNQYNSSDLASNKVGAFDGFPLFLYNSSGVTTTKIFPTSPTVTHFHSGIFFGVGIPVNFSSLLKPGSK
jgi:hypothetical protein